MRPYFQQNRRAEKCPSTRVCRLAEILQVARLPHCIKRQPCRAMLSFLIANVRRRRTPTYPSLTSRPSPRGGKRTIVDAIARACEEVGFFGIVGHGVHEDTIAAVYREGRAFFGLPRDEKMEIARPAPAVSRGYNSLADQSLGNTLASGVPPDLQESFAIGPLNAGTGPYWTDAHGPIHFHPNLWPRRPPGFRAAVTAYYQSMEALSRGLRACLRLRSIFPRLL